MSKNIKLKKGFNIKLKGTAQKTLSEDIKPDTYALKPTDFPGVQRGKVLVSEGENVKAGTPIFFDKKMEGVMYASPVSGEIAEIRRGNKRKLLEIIILADKEVEFESFNKYTSSDIQNLDRSQIVDHIMKGGVWPNIIQRPYGVVANPSDTPKSIFISGFDTHPLAPDYGFLYNGEDRYLQAGVDVLKRLSEGSVNITLDGKGEVPTAFSQLREVEIHKVSGPHPAGNVGVHIHHIDPINKDEIVWTLTPFGVIQIGKLFLEGKHDAARTIAVTGSEVKEPKYYKTYRGAGLKKFLENKLNSDNVRVISGNVLTGESVGSDGYLGYYHNQVTVIPEGDHADMFGWALPNTKLSYHRGFGLFSFLNRNKEHALDTNTNGDGRPFVVTGSFEEVTPFDIYPTFLLKAILAEDFDDMEALGIYEIVEEDLALCEFIDVSKHEVQAIVREGIDLMINS